MSRRTFRRGVATPSIPSVVALSFVLLLSSSLSWCTTDAFTAVRPSVTTTTVTRPSHALPSPSLPVFRYATSGTLCRMGLLDDDDDPGPGLFTQVGVVFFIVVFLATSIVPLLGMLGNDPAAGDLNLGDAVATKNSKVVNYSNASDKLSRSKIQEKLNRVPVFYLSSGDADLGSDLYLSFEDATNAAGAGNGQRKVKCTTLDQVMYPLIFKRGRMRMAAPPPEVRTAEEVIASDATTSSTYKLVPSTNARNAADAMKLTVRDGDVPLFVADRLAFAGKDGPQVPLFLEREDCEISYGRLRKTGGNKLPEKPTIRTTTLLDTLDSMEKGTRPAVGQLQFYSPADDLLRASEML